MSDLWGVASNGVLLGRVPAGYVLPEGSQAVLIPPEEADALSFAWPDREPTPPSVPRVMPPRDFMDALPLSRQAEIIAAAMQTPAGMLWCMRLVGAVEVDCDHAETIAGIEAMRDAGAMTAAEANALLRRSADQGIGAP